MSRISRISIKRSPKEDLFYMPLAEICFYLDVELFVYHDYINPFINGLVNFFVSKTYTRNGDEKVSLCQGIASRFGMQYCDAVDLFNKIVPEINQYIRDNKFISVDFPAYDQLMYIAYQNGFKADDYFGLNFMVFRHGVELHIRAKTVESAMRQFLEYEADGTVFEQYTKASVQKNCNEYPGLRVAENQTGRKPGKHWILFEDLNGFHEKPYYFSCLRDIVAYLPLPHHCQNHIEPYYE